MGDCYITRRGGGSGGLNFGIETYASELLLPASAAENTIAVITDTAMTGYVISINTPVSPEEGMVWIKTGTNDVVSLNALKKDALMVYITGGSQYISGAWVGKTIMVYQSGSWKSTEYVVFDGSWRNGHSFVSLSTGYNSNSTITINNNANPATFSTDAKGAYIGGINTTGYRTLQITSSISKGNKTMSWFIYGLGRDTKWYDSATTNMPVSKRVTETHSYVTENFDISSLNETLYFKAYTFGNTTITFSLWDLKLIP